MAEIKFTKRSLDDIESIADYISRDSVRFAKITVQKILERTKILKNNTLSIHHSSRDLSKRGILP